MKKTFKRLGAMFLAMVMAVSVLCTGALAANYTITINGKSEGHVYEAYQVFTGTLSTKTAANPETQTKAEYTLSDIVWGSAVKGDDDGGTFLTKLKADSTLSSIFNVDTCNTAADVANILSTNKTADLAENFAAFVGKYVVDNKTSATATSGEQTSGTTYTIDVQNPGYYLVKDKQDSITGTDNKAYTRYMLEVVGPQVVDSKDSIPTVTKKVNNKEKADTAQIGDKVKFTLTGTLPTTYDDYKTYKYVFNDTLSEGLTYYNTTDDTNYKLKVTIDTEDGTDITSSFTVTPNGQTLTISCDNLKDVTAVKKNTKIIVTYYATVNNKATAGKDKPNTNSVNLMYSNNPNVGGESSTGKTPDDVVNVYTFELDVTKKETGTETKLGGAQFVLATEANLTVTSDGFNEEDGTAKEGTKTTGLIAVTGNTPNYTIDDGTATSKTYVMSTEDKTGALNITGLKPGKYYLYETKAPAGYNKLTEPVEITITATQDTKTGEIENTSDFTAKVGNDVTNATLSTGIVTATVNNSAGSNLPSTGGMGTKLFYTIGGLLMAGAAIVLVIKKRRSSAE